MSELAEIIARWDANEGKPCACGCGEPLRPFTRTNRRKGQVKGQMPTFKSGHNKRHTANLDRYVKQGDCWIWIGPINRKGYGRCQVDGIQKNAHRAVYERLHGPLPRHLHLDHLCRNKLCVRPDHMEPVTAAENNRRKSNPPMFGFADPESIPALPDNYGDSE